MLSNKIRSTFIDYFKSKGHNIVSPSSILNFSDPTLMFTNAGMNQFKDIFLGNKKTKYSKVVNSQPCLRVTGKHNDLEEVGVDTYHHTLFEMLGNWSFVEYFKEKAIEYAWELINYKFNIPIENIYVTVFEGNQNDNLKQDQESYNIWQNYIPKDRIIFCPKKENFWEMGSTGPCGPSSEIHVDIRSNEEKNKVEGKTLVNKDHPQVIEIWNLVFIEYNRLSSGKLEKLKNKFVDTGMGLERLAMVLQNKKSNYDTDIFEKLIKKISQISHIKYNSKNKTDIAIRVIADHIRAITIAISDKIIPSNNKEGYVIRRILRRAIRYGYTHLNLKEPFIYQLVPIVTDYFKNLLPNIEKQTEQIQKIIKGEEESFIFTLKQGLAKLDTIVKFLNGNQLDGKTAFEMYDTYGFPIDLTTLILREKSISVDIKEFKNEMEIQKNRSKNRNKVILEDWIEVNKGKTTFVGYDFFDSETKIIKYQKIKNQNKDIYKIVLEKTPFYPEGGGQIGDEGILFSKREKIEIFDTKKENDTIVHLSYSLPEDIKANFRAEINQEKRYLISRNHSATHILQSVLKSILGEHVQQKGSLVTDKTLRFDFSHFAKINFEQLKNIEKLVNEKILENHKKHERRDVPIDLAKDLGATALFGEKYSEKVRVITFDEGFSIELCGGTHVNQTLDIGLFKIINESSIASGIRRIEAVTSKNAINYINMIENKLYNVSSCLNFPKDIKSRVHKLICLNDLHDKSLKASKEQLTNYISKEILKNKKIIGSYNIVIYETKAIDNDHLKQISFKLEKELKPSIIILLSTINEKHFFNILISNNIKIINAKKLLNNILSNIDGNGGGSPNFATGVLYDKKDINIFCINAEKLIQDLLQH